MPIPATRAQLVDAVSGSYRKLADTLQEAGARAGSLPCDGAWTVKDVLVVRAWWTEHVVMWIEAGLRDQKLELPAAGYGWKQTPQLNDDTVKRARRESYRSVRQRLHDGYERVMVIIEQLPDRQLLRSGAFDWAGKWPVARWISVNTATQYASARTMIRRALRDRDT